MLVESKKGGISRCSNRTLGGRNAEGKGGWSPKLTSTKKHKKSAKVSRTGKLLQTIH